MLHLCYLAAGSGSRFGGNKLLAVFNGRPLWQYGYRVLKQVSRRTGAKLHVVTRYPQILKEVGETGVFCPESEKGLSFSVRAACLACGMVSGQDKLLFLAADQPYITADTVVRLLRISLAALPEQVRLPLAAAAWDGTRTGNPVVFSGLLVPEMLLLTGDQGGKAVLRDRPERVEKLACPGRQLVDIDTPDDLQLTE